MTRYPWLGSDAQGQLLSHLLFKIFHLGIDRNSVTGADSGFRIRSTLVEFSTAVHFQRTTKSSKDRRQPINKTLF